MKTGSGGASCSRRPTARRTTPPTADDQGPTTEELAVDREPDEVKVAIIGHPNVGKSTLLNQLTGTSRAIVSPDPRHHAGRGR